MNRDASSGESAESQSKFHSGESDDGDVHDAIDSDSEPGSEGKSPSSRRTDGVRRVTRANDVTVLQLLLKHSGPASKGATPLLISLTGSEYFIKSATAVATAGADSDPGSSTGSRTSNVGVDSESVDSESDHWHDDRILLDQFPKPGVRVILEHDGRNPHDRNAIRVLRERESTRLD